MDLQDLSTVDAADEGAWLHLEHPTTGKPLYLVEGNKEDLEKPVRIKIAGSDSKRARRKRHELQAKRLNRKIRGGRMPKISPEEVEDDGRALIEACVLDFENIYLGGEFRSCTPKNITLVFDTLPWALEQADTFFGDRGEYLGN